MSNIRGVDRDQLLLMPPSLAEWLPGGHLAWFVLEVVEELDLSGLYGALRADGRGGASYDPAMMLAVLVYGYCVGERSSRGLERRLLEDVAFRVVAANQRPDHATLARFRRRHQDAIGELFGQVVGLCVAAGLVDTGVVAIDGTKVAANASGWANRTARQIAEEILAEAEEVDAAEDELFGDRRGDELPPQWADRRGRPERLREALRRLNDPPSAAEAGGADAEGPGAEPSPPEARGRVNVTDPDSRRMRGSGGGYVQGYNAQAAVTDDQVVVAAEVTTDANDVGQFVPMVDAARTVVDGAGAEPVGAFVADAGYWSVEAAAVDVDADVFIAPQAATQGLVDDTDPEWDRRRRILAQVDRGERTVRDAAAAMGLSLSWTQELLRRYRTPHLDRSRWRTLMRRRLATAHGAATYARRKAIVEPAFGNIKANLGFRQFARRGLAAVTSEWRLICIAHNLGKLYRSRLAT